MRPASRFAQILGESRHLVEGGLFLNHEGFDPIDGVHDGGVIPAPERTADLRKGEVGELPTQIHSGLAGPHERLLATGTGEVGRTEAGSGGSGRDDLLRMEGALGSRRYEVLEDVGGHVERDVLLREGGVGGDTGERPLQLADVVGYVGSDELEHRLRDLTGGKLGVLVQDGEPGLDVGGLDVG